MTRSTAHEEYWSKGDKAESVRDKVGRAILAKAVSGKVLGDELNKLALDRNEIEGALKSLCGTRGCQLNTRTPGDNAPITMLKDQRANVIAELEQAESRLYAEVDVIIEAVVQALMTGDESVG